MTRAKERLETISRHLNPKGVQHLSSLSWNNKCLSDENIQLNCTFDNPKLSLQQRQFYEENGYLVIKKLIPDELLDSYWNRFVDIFNGRVKIPSLNYQRASSLKNSNVSPENKIYKLQDLFVDDVLFGYCTLQILLDYVECFTGPNIMVFHSMLLNKPPDSGSLSSRHPLHQDLVYFPFRPPNRIVCAWTAMQHVNRQNGCLAVVPGSHKGTILPHIHPKWPGGASKIYHGIENFSEDMPRVHLEMEKGDTVFFHSLLIHGSGANMSTSHRKAISSHYAGSECHYEEIKGLMREELLELAKKKRINMDNAPLGWKLRSFLVRGERINM